MMDDRQLRNAMAFGRGPLAMPIPEEPTMNNMELAHAVWSWLVVIEGPYCVHLHTFTAGFEAGQAHSAGFESMQGFVAGWAGGQVERRC